MYHHTKIFHVQTCGLPPPLAVDVSFLSTPTCSVPSLRLLNRPNPYRRPRFSNNLIFSFLPFNDLTASKSSRNLSELSKKGIIAPIVAGSRLRILPSPAVPRLCLLHPQCFHPTAALITKNHAFNARVATAQARSLANVVAP